MKSAFPHVPHALAKMMHCRDIPGRIMDPCLFEARFRANSMRPLCGTPLHALTLQIFSQSFFEELDAFVDDATSRRLGNGAQYYGKRKSSFYGKDDSNRKRDKVRSARRGVSRFVLNT